jgi:hypothetical protein
LFHRPTSSVDRPRYTTPWLPITANLTLLTGLGSMAKATFELFGV